MPEEWRPIPGHEGRYEVSSLGRVRSLRYKRQTARVEPLRLSVNRGGYQIVSLNIAGRDKTFHVHRLVATVFHGPCPAGFQAAHLDNVRTNNVPGNLRWVTAKENHSHKIAHGTQQIGEKNPFAKLTEDAVRLIRSVRGGTKELAARFGVGYGAIQAVRRGERWKHIPLTVEEPT